MPLNLITDPWIPVRSVEGTRTIRPDQIADMDVLFPDWPRADLNLSCLELLIGLVFMADPPSGPEDWLARREADADRLREALAPLAPAFCLAGDGPRFLQDIAPLEGEPNAPDMLFIDSAGGNAARLNADLFVHRGRYRVLDPALAAMALFTLQAHAPAGGAGNRTSMRGGGPLVTLADPRGSLWDLVWANVPDGVPQGAETLPWMHATRTSDKGKVPTPPPETNSPPPEMFFGMPRRLRLVFGDGLVTGVIQRPFGTNYAGWLHPLTPYYQQKDGGEWLPRHPRPGGFGYRHWLGVVIEGQEGDRSHLASAIKTFRSRRRGLPHGTPRASVLVAGWSMDNMKPREYIEAREPLIELEEDRQLLLRGMVQAAGEVGDALRQALKPVLGIDDATAVAISSLQERFFFETEADFRARHLDLEKGEAAETVAQSWLADIRRGALSIFNEVARPGLPDRDLEDVSDIVMARSRLVRTLCGKGKAGERLANCLMIDIGTEEGMS